MQIPVPAFIDRLTQDASAAEIAEIEFRNSVAREIATRERRRQFAYRRLDLAKTIMSAVRAAENETAAAAAGAAAFKREFGWNTETEARKKVLAAFAPVSTAIWHAVRGAATEVSSVTPEQAMTMFEAWYRETHGSEALAVFDVELPELPVVEF